MSPRIGFKFSVLPDGISIPRDSIRPRRWFGFVSVGTLIVMWPSLGSESIYTSMCIAMLYIYILYITYVYDPMTLYIYIHICTYIKWHGYVPLMTGWKKWSYCDVTDATGMMVGIRGIIPIVGWPSRMFLKGNRLSLMGQHVRFPNSDTQISDKTI